MPAITLTSLQGRYSKWIVLVSWFGLPWAIVNGLVYYGEAVPQSVQWTTVELAGTASFIACAAGGIILLYLSKKYSLPRILIGGLVVVYLPIGVSGFPHYTCGPKYVQSKEERQQAGSRIGAQEKFGTGGKFGQSCP